MAAGRDIALATRLIRQRQRRENARALAEEQERRTEAEAISEMRPSELRKRNNALRREERERQRLASAKQDSEPYEDKMDRGWGWEDKGGENSRELHETGSDGSEEGGECREAGAMNLTHEEVEYASPQARELAKELGLRPDDVMSFVASGKTGYTKGDVEDIAAFLADEGE